MISLKEFKQFAAEFLGTMLLMSIVGVSTIGFDLYSHYQTLYIPLVIGLGLMVLVYGLGPISGAHFNPAISIGLFAFKRLKLTNLLGFLAAQIAGAYVGLLLIKELVGEVPVSLEQNTNNAKMAEFLGAAFLTYVVAQCVMGKIKEEVSGLAIGLTLATAITLTMAASGGVLNPALALAQKDYQLSYLLFPILGGLVGTALAVWFDEKNK